MGDWSSDVCSSDLRVIAGELALSPDLAARMARRGATAASQATLGLSVREFDIFRLIASGKTHVEIAALLSLSVKTVTNQHSLIRQKLAIGSDIELFQLAVECGAVEARAKRS
jgi:two-component system, NarL family, invasion response regulator UvrY